MRANTLKLLFRHRRNLLTFSETTLLYYVLIIYIPLESGVIFLMYHIQDRINSDNVFFIVHSLSGLFDLLQLVGGPLVPGAGGDPMVQVVIPWCILYTSYTSHHQLWTTFQPRCLAHHLGKPPAIAQAGTVLHDAPLA